MSITCDIFVSETYNYIQIYDDVILFYFFTLISLMDANRVHAGCTNT